MKEKLKEFWENLKLVILVLYCFDFKKNVVTITDKKLKMFFKNGRIMFPNESLVILESQWFPKKNTKLVIKGVDLNRLDLFATVSNPSGKPLNYNNCLLFENCNILNIWIYCERCNVTFKNCKIERLYCNKGNVSVSYCEIDVLDINEHISNNNTVIKKLIYNTPDVNFYNSVVESSEYEGNIPTVSSCLDLSDLIVYKKVNYKTTKPSNNNEGEAIVTLKIKKGTPASGFIDSKCRCAEAKVMDIQLIAKSKNSKKCLVEIVDENLFKFHSDYDPYFIYKIGETVKPTRPFIPNNLDKCETGIHFFLTKKQALDY